MVDKDPEIIGKMFDDISSDYDKMNRIMTAGIDVKWRKDAVGYIRENNFNKGYILDLASGTGDLAEAFSSLEPDILVSADFSPEMLKINKKRNIKNNFVLCADSAQLPFINETFDIIGISFGVRNFKNVDVSLKEIRRVLKKNGKLLIIEMFSYDKKNFIDRLFSFYFGNVIPLIAGVFSGNKIAYHYLQKSVENFFTINEFKEILNANSFDMVFQKRNFLKIVYTLILNKNEN